MQILTGLAIALLSTTAIYAQAPAATPAIGQRLAAERPEITKLMDTFDFPQAQAKAEALIPATKPAFDKATVKALHESTRNYVDLCQVYFTAFQAADSNGQWEKGLEYLNKALDVAKDNVAQGKDALAEQRDYWAKKALSYKGLLDKNADAIAALKAKTKLEDYEEGSMTQVKGWEKEQAEGEKWSKFFQYDIDMAARNVEDFQKFVGIQEAKIKDQVDGIDTYKAFPGNKVKWVEAVISSKTYFDNFTKGDKLAFLYRLSVLDPENHKVRNAIDVSLGKAAPEKETAPKHHKK